MEAPCKTCPYPCRSTAAEQTRIAKLLPLLQLLALPVPGMFFLLLLLPQMLRLLLGELVEQVDFAQLAGSIEQAVVAEVL